jgi:NADPH:quinone reductase-like Zn-dependent oxidoreductase
MPRTMMEKETMKAVQIHAFGGPEVLQYEDVRKPAKRKS